MCFWINKSILVSLKLHQLNMTYFFVNIAELIKFFVHASLPNLILEYVVAPNTTSQNRRVRWGLPSLINPCSRHLSYNVGLLTLSNDSSCSFNTSFQFEAQKHNSGTLIYLNCIPLDCGKLSYNLLGCYYLGFVIFMLLLLWF